MKMRTTGTIIAMALALLLAACGGDDSDEPGDKGSGTEQQQPGAGQNDPATGADNVAACKDWLAKHICGDFDLNQAVPCDRLGQYRCDLTPYFTCLDHNFHCVDGMPDVTVLSACSQKIDPTKCQ